MIKTTCHREVAVHLKLFYVEMRNGAVFNFLF